MSQNEPGCICTDLLIDRACPVHGEAARPELWVDSPAVSGHSPEHQHRFDTVVEWTITNVRNRGFEPDSKYGWSKQKKATRVMCSECLETKAL